MSESNEKIQGYELNEEEWDLVDIFKNPDDLSKAEWQKKYPLKTKKDWDALEEEINREVSEMFPFSQAILKSTDLSSIPTEIYESLVELRLPQFKDIFQEDVPIEKLDLGQIGYNRLKRSLYNSIHDFSGMNYLDLVNISEMDTKRANEIFYNLNKHGFINDELIKELDNTLKSLEKEIAKELDEVCSKPPGRELQKSNINIVLPEIKSQRKLIDLGISRVGLLIKEEYLIAKDLSQMSFDNLLNIHHNLTAQGVLDIFVKLSKHKIIKDQLVVELKKALETLALNWTGEYVPYKDQTNKF